MDDVVFLDPIFRYSIQNSIKLQNYFFNIKLNENIGEAWIISAMSDYNSIVEFGVYENMQLNKLYLEYPELFNYPEEKNFPLFIKILDTQSNLNVQVDLDEAYTQKTSMKQEKMKCWYILDADENSHIILGHKAKTKDEFSEQIKLNIWEEFLIKIPVKKDNFFYIPNGTLHALGTDSLVLEIQHSSNITYQLNDYKHEDRNENKAKLRLSEVLKVITIFPKIQKQQKQIIKFGKNVIGTLIENKFFTVKKLHVEKEFYYRREADYILVTIIGGLGMINNRIFSKGTSFMIPATISKVKFNGLFNAIIIYVN